MDYLVLTREKQPGIFVRKEILESLRNKVKMTDTEIQQMTKGRIHECWGDDMYLWTCQKYVFKLFDIEYQKKYI